MEDYVEEEIEDEPSLFQSTLSSWRRSSTPIRAISSNRGRGGGRNSNQPRNAYTDEEDQIINTPIYSWQGKSCGRYISLERIRKEWINQADICKFEEPVFEKIKKKHVVDNFERLDFVFLFNSRLVFCIIIILYSVLKFQF